MPLGNEDASTSTVILGSSCFTWFASSHSTKHPWQFPASAIASIQALFHMNTFTASVTILKIYSQMFQDWIAPLPGSKSASSCHFEQFWDPSTGNSTLSLWISDSLEEIAHCREMLSGGLNSVDSMAFSYDYKQVPFQAGRGVIVVIAVFTQGSVDHEYYSCFDHDSTGTVYAIGTFFDRVSTGRDFYAQLAEVYPNFGYHHNPDQVKEHQLQWDPGGSQ
uniref:Uncharacterized protein n=1 Tax=Triticum urartu TaxID=4572 RepID=A0A8R7QG31_TRIUA